MFKKSIATFAMVATLVAGASMTMSTTEAEARGGRNAAFAFGAITGLAVGAAVANNRYYGPYYDNRRYYRPRPVPVRYGRPAPWTAAWYDYCSARYRSFNPRTGYFITYSGHRRFCR